MEQVPDNPQALDQHLFVPDTDPDVSSEFVTVAIAERVPPWNDRDAVCLGQASTEWCIVYRLTTFQDPDPGRAGTSRANPFNMPIILCHELTYES